MSSGRRTTGPWPTSELSPIAQVYELQLERAGKLFHERKHEQANNICYWLLSHANLGNFHRAGAHLILAYSPDDYVYHAEEALRLYKTLRADTEALEANRDKWVKKATEVLEKQKENEKIYGGYLEGEEAEKEIDWRLQEMAVLRAFWVFVTFFDQVLMILPFCSSR